MLISLPLRLTPCLTLLILAAYTGHNQEAPSPMLHHRSDHEAHKSARQQSSVKRLPCRPWKIEQGRLCLPPQLREIHWASWQCMSGKSCTSALTGCRRQDEQMMSLGSMSQMYVPGGIAPDAVGCSTILAAQATVCQHPPRGTACCY